MADGAAVQRIVVNHGPEDAPGGPPFAPVGLALLVQLRAAGVRTRTVQPVDIPVGSYAGGKAAYVFDPDGVEIELIERRRGISDGG